MVSGVIASIQGVVVESGAIGHFFFFQQYLHSCGVSTTKLFSPYGLILSGDVDPNKVMVGIP